jgi:Fe-S cluster biogenesis protein NfuA
VDTIAKIEALLDNKVRPALALHRGDVRVVSYENGILKIRLLGQCSNCPSASDTTQDLVAGELISAVPELRQVVLETGVSDELLEQARALLRSRI